MRVLHVCGTFPPAYAYGGPPRSVHSLTAALVELGHDVTVYTTDANDADSRIDAQDMMTIKDGIQIRRFRNVSNNLAWHNIQFPPRMLLALLRNASKFDVVHSHEFRSPPSTFAHYAAMRAGTPHIHQPRGSIPRFDLTRLKKYYDYIIGKGMINETDRIIASATVESKNYNIVFPDIDMEKIVHIPNGIAWETYQELPEQGGFRSELGIPPTNPLILFLSRLHPRKGGDLLIKAVSELDDDSELVFVGPDEGGKRKWKMIAEEEGISGRVTFDGPRFGRGKLEAYVDSDVFVLPSINEYESFGNVVIEAMACGTPTVATNVCGVSEWIPDDLCQTVKPTSFSICDGIESVLEDPPPIMKIREFVKERFTWQAVAHQTEMVYSEICK